jgi:hypothetical protein
MVTTHELKGTKEQIVQQLEHMSGRIVSAIVVVEESQTAPFISDGDFVPPSDEELEKMMKELESLAVSAPRADDSREAMYTRMPGE